MVASATPKAQVSNIPVFTGAGGQWHHVPRSASPSRDGSSSSSGSGSSDRPPRAPARRTDRAISAAASASELALQPWRSSWDSPDTFEPTIRLRPCTNSSGTAAPAATAAAAVPSSALTLVLLCASCVALCYMDRSNMSTAILPMSQSFGWDKVRPGPPQPSGPSQQAACSLRLPQPVHPTQNSFNSGTVDSLSQHMLARHRQAAAHQPRAPRSHHTPCLPCTPHPQAFQGVVMSSFFVGYALTQTLGGYLADRYGGKPVLAGGVAVWSLCSALIPAAAAAGMVPLLAIRCACGWERSQQARRVLARTPVDGHLLMGTNRSRCHSLINGNIHQASFCTCHVCPASA